MRNPWQSAFTITLVVILSLKIQPTTSVACEKISTVVGTGVRTAGQDGVQANSTSLYDAFAVAPDDQGYVFTVEMGANRVKQVDLTTGIISLVGVSSTYLSYPSSIFCQSNAPTCFISSWNGNKIFKLTTRPTPVYTLFAGGGTLTLENIPALNTSLNRPWDVTLDSNGNLYYTEYAGHVIRKIDISGNVTTVLGNRTSLFSGDNGPANLATTNSPMGVFVDRNGVVYFTEIGRVRKIGTNGIVITIAGGGGNTNPNNIPALSASLGTKMDVVATRFGDLLIADRDRNSIFRLKSSDGYLEYFAGNGTTTTFNGAVQEATMVTLRGPTQISLDKRGNLYLAEVDNSSIRKITTCVGYGVVNGNTCVLDSTAAGSLCDF
jgi:hypothetical protein